MYGEEFPKETWIQRYGYELYGTILAGALLGGFCWMVFYDKPQPETPPAVLDVDRTNALATAKCGEYEMDWLQYTDAARIYKNRHSDEEAVLYCINRETNVTVRELIPLILIEEDDTNQ